MALVRTLDRQDKVETKPFSLLFVEPCCRNELVLRVGMKLDALHRIAERAFLITLSAGIAWTLRDLWSARRTSASSKHHFSAIASASFSMLDVKHSVWA